MMRRWTPIGRAFFPAIAGLLLSSVALSIAAEGIDRPFGLKQGQKIEIDYSAITLVRRSERREPSQEQAALAQKAQAFANEFRLEAYDPVRSVPKPHPLLNHYTILSKPTAGLCSVIGAAKVDSRDARNPFDVLHGQLAEVMGAPSGNLVSAERSAVWKLRDGPVRSVSLASFDSTVLLKFDFSNIGECDPGQVGNPFR